MNDNEGDAEKSGNVYHITQHIQATNIGAVSGGNISAETIAAVARVENADTKEILAQVLQVIAQVQDEKVRAENEQVVRELAAAPTPGKWKKVLGFLNGVKNGAIAIGGAVGGVEGLIDSVTLLIP